MPSGLGDGFVEFTTYRSPVDRLISDYKYLTSTGETEWSKLLIKLDPSLNNFLSKLQIWQVNPLTQYLAGASPAEPLPPAEAFMSALNNLENRIWLAVPDRSLSYLICLAARRFGWRQLSFSVENESFDMSRHFQYSNFDREVENYIYLDQLLYKILEKMWYSVLMSVPSSFHRLISDIEKNKTQYININQKMSENSCLHNDMFEFLNS